MDAGTDVAAEIERRLSKPGTKAGRTQRVVLRYLIEAANGDPGFVTNGRRMNGHQ